MDKIKQLQVLYEGRTVGTMALYRKHLAAFQYSEEWIADGFSVSPFSLPLGKKVFVPQILPFDGIFGVFADSLPDGWGRLLVDHENLFVVIVILNIFLFLFGFFRRFFRRKHQIVAFLDQLFVKLHKLFGIGRSDFSYLHDIPPTD